MKTMTNELQYAVCHTCRLKHLSAPRSDEALEFLKRHLGHHTEIVPESAIGHNRFFKILKALKERFAVDQMRVIGDTMVAFDRLGVSGYSGNANVKEAFGTATAFTKTNANLVNSATAGWQSNSIDNSSNLYLDALVSLELAAVNSAPANSKAVYMFAFALIEGTAWTSTGDGTPNGSEGTLTYPDVTANPIVAPVLGIVPYPIQNKAINGGPFSVASCFGSILPPKWAVGMINFSGMTLSVTNIYYIEKYLTVI